MARKWTLPLRMMTGIMLLGLLAACGGGGGSPTATPAGPGQAATTPTPSNYFAGKTLNIIIPYAPGGSSAVLVPFFATELPKFIPGSPRITSSHLTPVTTGMNYLMEARKDGTELMYVATPQLAQQFAEGANFRVGAFEYIGGFTVNNAVLFVTQQVTAPDFVSLRGMPTQLRLALPTDPGDLSQNELAVLLAADALGIPIQGIPLSGATTGTPELFVALERGDINGMAQGTVYYTLPQLRPGWTRDGFVRPLVFIGRPGTEMPPNTEHNVTAPNLTDIMLNDPNVSEERKEQFRAFGLASVALGRHFMFPPDTDPVAVETFRQGFAAAMEDQAFLTELERLLGLEPVLVDGAEFQQIAEEADAAFEAQRDNLQPLQLQLWEQFTGR